MEDGADEGAMLACAVRLPGEGEDSGWSADSQVEETGVRDTVLHACYPEGQPQLRHHLPLQVPLRNSAALFGFTPTGFPANSYGSIWVHPCGCPCKLDLRPQGHEVVSRVTPKVVSRVTPGTPAKFCRSLGVVPQGAPAKLACSRRIPLQVLGGSTRS